MHNLKFKLTWLLFQKGYSVDCFFALNQKFFLVLRIVKFMLFPMTVTFFQITTHGSTVREVLIKSASVGKNLKEHYLLAKEHMYRLFKVSNVDIFVNYWVALLMCKGTLQKVHFDHSLKAHESGH